MIKKIYGLFSVLLLLASCATEEIEQIEIQPTDGSMVSLSFSVDAPNALEITKATGDVEKGVESLYLYTFNEDGEFISPVVEAVVSGNGYTASISKETRTIHFVANDGTLTPSLESGMASLVTDKQIFWGKRTFSDIPAKNISNSLEAAGSNNVELLRNWAKITLNLSSEAAEKLENVSYLIYNESQLASIKIFMRHRMSQRMVNMQSWVNLCILLNIIIKIRKRLLLLLRRNLMVARPIHIIRLILP